MSKKRILIIDDDPDFSESVKVILESENYEVFCAKNKKEGRDEVEKLYPDLIIMDVMMEKMSDGFDLSRELKSDKKYKDIPILVMTAVGVKTGFKFSIEAGDKAWLPVEDYVEKPVKPAKLISIVKRLIK